MTLDHFLSSSYWACVFISAVSLSQEGSFGKMLTTLHLLSCPQMNAQQRWAYGWKLSPGSPRGGWGTCSWGAWFHRNPGLPRTLGHPSLLAACDTSLCGSWNLLCGPKVEFNKLSGYLTHLNILKFYLQINTIFNLPLPVHSSLNSFSFKDISTHVLFPNVPSSAGGIRRETENMNI